jgi:hypothetical protein
MRQITHEHCERRKSTRNHTRANTHTHTHTLTHLGRKPQGKPRFSLAAQLPRNRPRANHALRQSPVAAQHAVSLWAVAVILLIADESSGRLAQALQRRLLVNVAQLANIIRLRAHAFGLGATVQPSEKNTNKASKQSSGKHGESRHNIEKMTCLEIYGADSFSVRSEGKRHSAERKTALIARSAAQHRISGERKADAPAFKVKTAIAVRLGAHAVVTILAVATPNIHVALADALLAVLAEAATVANRACASACCASGRIAAAAIIATKLGVCGQRHA